MTDLGIDIPRVRRRSRAILITGQALAGLGTGATFSAGALLMAQVSGTPAWSGMAATMSTLGSALVALPLAALARRRGRAIALSTGATVAAIGASVGLVAAIAELFPLLLVGFALLGVGGAVNLQSRFAATDLSEPGRQGRDLALVVWATTVGAVAGPNLIGPADAFGQAVQLPPLAGVFLFTIAAQLVATVLYLIGLRPDPLRLALQLGAAPERAGEIAVVVGDRGGVRLGMLALALSHATMVSVMSMTPVHLVDHGASLSIVGFTLSLHVAGMYALSPVFGGLSDRFGRGAVILVGQGLLAASLVMTAAGAENETWVAVGLVLLGLGWSASTVAGSALVAESAPSERRTTFQGRSDLLMSAAGAIGGASAGPVLAVLGYSGLSLVTLTLVAVVVTATVVRAGLAIRRRAAE